MRAVAQYTIVDLYDVDSVEVGARNLLLKSGSERCIALSAATISYDSGVVSVIDENTASSDSDGNVTFTNDAAVSVVYNEESSELQLIYADVGLYQYEVSNVVAAIDHGSTFTVSVFAKATKDSTFKMLIYSDKEVLWDESESVMLTSDYERYVFQLDAPNFVESSTYYIRFTFSGTSGVAYLRNAKAECGNVSTSWSPAPEDVDSDIEDVASGLKELQENYDSYVSSINKTLEDINDQLDDSITTWYYSYAPTASNEPAAKWVTNELQVSHIGDLFYDSSTGYCYRWTKNGSSYQWELLQDKDISDAMSAAKAAQDTADNKRRVFFNVPTPPYDVGDLWAEGATGDLWRCIAAKSSSEKYSPDDWVLATKYTDDTTVNKLKESVIVKVDVYYIQTSSGIDSPELDDKNWVTDAADIKWADGEYIWQKTVTTYGDGSTYTTSPVCITGGKGATGSTGKTGATGVGVSSITEQYYLSTSSDSNKLDGDSWHDDVMPAWSDGKYIFTRTKVTYDNGTVSYTDPVLASALNDVSKNASDAIEAANTASARATAYRKDKEPTEADKDGYKAGDIWIYHKQSESDTGQNDSDGIDDGIDEDKIYQFDGKDWVQSTIGTTSIINGSITTDLIASNAITAEKINVDDLFSENITATGTITGAKLISPEISANEISITATDEATADKPGQFRIFGMFNSIKYEAFRIEYYQGDGPIVTISSPADARLRIATPVIDIDSRSYTGGVCSLNTIEICGGVHIRNDWKSTGSLALDTPTVKIDGTSADLLYTTANGLRGPLVVTSNLDTRSDYGVELSNGYTIFKRKINNAWDKTWLDYDDVVSIKDKVEKYSIKHKLLWSNGAYNSVDLFEEQTLGESDLSDNLSNYNFFYIGIGWGKGYEGTQGGGLFAYDLTRSTTNFTPSINWYKSGGGVEYVYRYVKLNRSKNTVQFSTGYIVTDSATTASNNHAIPMYIIGLNLNV